MQSLNLVGSTVARLKDIKNRYKNYRDYSRHQTIEWQKSAIRSLLDHPFLYVKRRFYKAIYKGIAKNLNRLETLRNRNEMNELQFKR